jgi:hypothetical protein
MGRSSYYFGINLYGEHSLFHRTSARMTNVTRNPLPKEFRKTESTQAKQRKELIDKGEQFGLNQEQINKEWQAIVLKATEHVTAWIEKNHPEIISNGIIIETDSTSSALSEAAVEGLGELIKHVKKRAKLSHWWQQPQQFLFQDHGETHIYIYQQRHHSAESAGKKVYKIGKTTKPNDRRKAHRTSNTDLHLIAEYTEEGILTETNIHRFFKASRLDGEREWFLLSDAEAALVASPHRMKNEISK